ncbi:hypothetical protein IPV08_12060 [Methylobacterium sp. SD274]|uniref:imm11 family protein n=1 Tax=Methylobacterium sp. SD274 TaxID=2782009 RepID=UPI001A963AA7|nr:DUF1629 domain-containing protein [Methylobacterium sp. SD274]MBO1020707.1 hypothetical protein [Methylobacterium sp. SD274]
MVWGLVNPSSIGEFFPSGDYVGWKEAIERYFNEEMSADRRAAHDNWHGSYRGDVARKFTEDFGPLEPHERPTEFRVVEPPKALGSLIKMTSRLLAVDTALKDIIEALEPGVHQFWPIRIVTPKGKEYPGAYHGLIIRRFLDSFLPEQSKGFRFTPSSSQFAFADRDTKVVYADLAVTQDVVAGAHLWREDKLSSPRILMSDALQAEIVAQNLRIFKHHKLKVV